ncbi:lamin tail domain-containing protein [Candidatus Woesearchaeota archaeon]|nr:lamin tail domain-containing protein [Candidatus Woesearchaeota archaeon]
MVTPPRAVQWRIPLTLGALALLMAPLAAAMLISEALPDALNESSGEAVAIYNDGTEITDLSGWHLSTASSERDAVIPANTSLLPGQVYILADKGFLTPGRAADHEEPITLANSNSGVALRDAEGRIVDALGWGDRTKIPEALFKGEPAAQPGEGKTLLRVSNTNDNLHDFTLADGVWAGIPDSISLTIEVTSQPSSSVVVPDDMPAAGIQWLPMPGRIRELAVSVVQTAEHDVVVEFDDRIVGEAYGAMNVSMPVNLSFDVSPGKHSLTVRAASEHSFDIEVLPVAGIRLDAQRVRFSLTAGTTAKADSNLPRVTNIGNTPVQLAAGLREARLPGTVSMAVGDIWQNMTRTITAWPSRLSPSETVVLGFAVSVQSNATAGLYADDVLVVAVP